MTQGFELIQARGNVQYQIRHYDEGVVIFSHTGIPVSVITTLGKLVPGPDSKKIIAMSLHPYFERVLEASVVYVIAQNEKALLAWEKKAEEHIASMQGLSVLERWLMGLDTGTSSKTMVQAAIPHARVTSNFGIPHDPDDFGRCMRAVDYFTSATGTAASDTRERFLDPANYEGKGKEWPRILEQWDELCAVARQAGLSKRRGKFSKAHCEKLYQMLQQIKHPAL